MFGSGRSYRLFRIAGISVEVSITWFAILFIVIVLLAGSFHSTLNGPYGGSSMATAYLTAVATAALFFGSLIVHELGHAFTARHHGIGVSRVELYLFGGMTYMDREPATPREEFEVAAAGPLGTFAMVVLFAIVDLLIVGPSRLLHAVELDGNVQITPVLLSMSWLLAMNVFILIFNLIPAYPLDGGRIARAVVWWRTGDALRGTAVAAQLGRGFALLLGLAGVAIMVGGSAFSGVWLIAIAWMMYQSAAATAKMAAVRGRVREVHVADVMDSDSPLLALTTPVHQACEEGFDRYDMPWMAVVDQSGRLAGIARRYRIDQLNQVNPDDLVQNALETDQSADLRVAVEAPLTDALALPSLTQMGALIAVDGGDIVRGILRVADVRGAVTGALAGNGA